MKQILQFIAMVLPVFSIAQGIDSAVNHKAFDIHALSKIETTVNDIDKKIEKKTVKALEQMQKQEHSIQSKLASKDSLVAKQLSAIDNTYNSLTEKIKHTTEVKGLKEYIPGFDSLKTGFKFLESTGSLKSKFPKEWTNKIKSVNGSIQGLESKMQQANDVQKFLKERRQHLKEQLEKYGLSKELKKMNKQVYYYQQQLNEYKALLKDPKKIEQRAITELRKLPAFKAFMQKNSQLAQLFKLPDSYGTQQSLAGLQTRASVQDQLRQRFGGSGVNPQQYAQQQMGQAQGELNKLKDKVNKLGGGSSDVEMPDFNPNTQKTKSFLKRLEFGANVQSQKTNGWLPVTSDIAFTAGYKLNDKSIIGIGAAYKLGWGSSIKDIRLSSQGIGLRSYIAYKIKGGFWISGGYEQNYQHAFRQVEQLRQYQAWQTSGLIGLTKKYKIRKKTNNLQVLWDFMSYQQKPKRPSILLRVGYKL